MVEESGVQNDVLVTESYTYIYCLYIYIIKKLTTENKII